MSHTHTHARVCTRGHTQPQHSAAYAESRRLIAVRVCACVCVCVFVYTGSKRRLMCWYPQHMYARSLATQPSPHHLPPSPPHTHSHTQPPQPPPLTSLHYRRPPYTSRHPHHHKTPSHTHTHCVTRVLRVTHTQCCRTRWVYTGQPHPLRVSLRRAG